ncbi:MAG: hypothetical protein PHG44_02160 [Lentisphaeria bacterium]|nr:hypothetical protein [Lentisphaeria bacterium]MDY0177273.1 hypothetical protein [Lentisphaeria bacterium]
MTTFYPYNALSELLNLKPPLLMLDCLLVDRGNCRASGSKLLSINEPFFAGHFPAHPVMPGVLQVAAMTQAASAILKICRPASGSPELLALRRVKFRKPVQPGMNLQLEAALSGENDDGVFDFEVKCYVDEQLASSGTLSLAYKQEDWFALAQESYNKQSLSDIYGDAQPADCQEIMRHLPHRPPFLLLDTCFNLGQGDCALGYKNISGNDPLCQATQPACFPGYLQIEACAQLGSAHILSQPEQQGKLGLFMSIDHAIFHAPVLPGQQMHMQVVSSFGGRFGVGAGQAKVNGKVVAEADIKFAILAIENS